jgi:hypothetical protein
LACEGQSGPVAEFHAAPAAGAAVAKAAGDVESQLDGTTVNTTGGWRDMKIGIFARREPGEKAAAAEWDSRHLPGPSARVAFEPIDRFAPRVGRWAGRLGLADTAAITTLGDGAAWIWDAAAEQLPGSGGVLEIYHASQHVSDAGKGLFGEGTAAARAWLEGGRALLLSDGWAGLCDHIGATLLKHPGLPGHAALGELTGYFAAHTKRLNYAQRLHAGRSIGSGMVEGAAKNLIGKRIKQTGARWVVGNADAMASLCSLSYSDTGTSTGPHPIECQNLLTHPPRGDSRSPDKFVWTLGRSPITNVGVTARRHRGASRTPRQHGKTSLARPPGRVPGWGRGPPGGPES